MQRSNLFLAFLALVVLGLGLTPVAWGQDSPDSSDDAEVSEPQDAVSDEIIVTARKREENIQEIPVAVTMLAGEALEDSGTSDLADIQAQVPNLSIYPGRNQSTTLTALGKRLGSCHSSFQVSSSGS